MIKEENYNRNVPFVSVGDELRKTLPQEIAKKATEAILGKKGKYIIIKTAKSANGKRLILSLNNVGDLWREPKSKYCYLMGVQSDRHKIVRYLATNRGYQQTSAVSLALDGKSEQSIRTEIAKIRSNIKNFIKVDGKQVIEGRRGSGYRIGSKCKIKIIA